MKKLIIIFWFLLGIFSSCNTQKQIYMPSYTKDCNDYLYRYFESKPIGDSTEVYFSRPSENPSARDYSSDSIIVKCNESVMYSGKANYLFTHKKDSYSRYIIYNPNKVKWVNITTYNYTTKAKVSILIYMGFMNTELYYDAILSKYYPKYFELHWLNLSNCLSIKEYSKGNFKINRID